MRLFLRNGPPVHYRKIMDRWKYFSANHSPPFHRKWCLPYNINFLLTESEVFTEKYRTEVFFTGHLGRGFAKRPRSDISLYIPTGAKLEGGRVWGGLHPPKIWIIPIGKAIKDFKWYNVELLSNLLQLANNKQFVCMYIGIDSSIIHVA